MKKPMPPPSTKPAPPERAIFAGQDSMNAVIWFGALSVAGFRKLWVCIFVSHGLRFCARCRPGILDCLGRLPPILLHSRKGFFVFLSMRHDVEPASQDKPVPLSSILLEIEGERNQRHTYLIILCSCACSGVRPESPPRPLITAPRGAEPGMLLLISAAVVPCQREMMGSHGFSRVGEIQAWCCCARCVAMPRLNARRVVAPHEKKWISLSISATRVYKPKRKSQMHRKLKRKGKCLARNTTDTAVRRLFPSAPVRSHGLGAIKLMNSTL